MSTPSKTQHGHDTFTLHGACVLLGTIHPNHCGLSALRLLRGTAAAHRAFALALHVDALLHEDLRVDLLTVDPLGHDLELRALVPDWCRCRCGRYGRSERGVIARHSLGAQKTKLVTDVHPTSVVQVPVLTPP